MRSSGCNCSCAFYHCAVLIENGIDISYCKKSLAYKTKEDLTIITVGRVCNQKNPELYNKIATGIPDVRFIWCGDSSKKFFSSDNIISRPFLPHEELMRLLEQADVFLLPSVFEGLSISLLEAMSYGKICIVSNAHGNCEIIKNGVNGFVCNEYQDYINVIHNIKENPQSPQYNAIRENARTTVREHFTNDIMFSKYMKLYFE